MTTALADTSAPTTDTRQDTTPAVRQRAFRLTLDPLDTQRDLLAQHAGTARWAYNHAIAAKAEAHELWRTLVQELVDSGVPEPEARKQVKVPIPTKAAIQKALNAIKGDETKGIEGPAAWWPTVSTYAFQSAFDNADRAWQNWIKSFRGERAGKRVGYPRFKKKHGSRDSFRLHHDINKPTIRPDGYRRLIMPRIGSVRLKNNCKRLVRAVKRGAVIKSVTVSRGGHQWYAAVLVEEPAVEATPTRRQRNAGRVGVALGVRQLATLSDKTTYANPRHLDKDATRLVKLQRATSRSQRGSNKRRKRAAKVGRLHHIIAERRASHLHQITKTLATTWAEIAVPKLGVADMVNVAKTRNRAPKTARKKIAATNRALLDAAPGEFVRQLTYKTSWYGSNIVVHDDASTASKTCSHCGAVKAKLLPEERVYTCTTCGTVLPRAVNTARNIAAMTASDTAPSTTVASDRGETQNARRADRRPAILRSGRQSAMKREDPG